MDPVTHSLRGRGPADEVSGRLPDRTGREAAGDRPASPASRSSSSSRAAPLARRLHDAGAERVGRRPPPHRHLPQGRPHPHHLRHRRGQRPAAACGRSSARSATRAARWSTCSGMGGGERRGARTTSATELPRGVLPVDGGAVRRPAGHRVQPLADARARAAVPALLRRRRPRPDPAAQRPGPGRDGQRPGAAQHPAPHQGDGDHRRAAGRDAARRTCGWRTCSTSRSSRSRRRRSASSSASRWSTCSRTTSAELLDRVDLVIDHHPRAARLQRGLQGHPRRLRLDVARSSPSTCARWT